MLEARKITTGEIRKSFMNYIALSDVDYIVKDLERIGYNSGTFGWNFDLYFLPSVNIAILTGYRNTISNMDYNLDDVLLANKECKEIYNSNKLSDEEKQQLIEDIRYNLFMSIRELNK